MQNTMLQWCENSLQHGFFALFLKIMAMITKLHGTMDFCNFSDFFLEIIIIIDRGVTDWLLAVCERPVADGAIVRVVMGMVQERRMST